MNTDPLIEWNRLNKENAERELISVMYGNLVSRTTQIDSFSTWLLATAGAAATLVVSNTQNIATILGKNGFKRALFCLIISALLGLIAKLIFVFFQYGGDQQERLLEQVKPIFTKFRDDEKQIIELSKNREMSLETELQMDLVLMQYAKPFPFLVRKILLKYITKHKHDPQIGYLLPLKAFVWQTSLSFLQALAFLTFIIVAVRYAQVA